MTYLVFLCLQALVQLGKERRARLEDSLKLYKFFGDMEEEEMFVKETENVLGSKDVGKDLISLTRLQEKHKVRYPCMDNGLMRSNTNVPVMNLLRVILLVTMYVVFLMIVAMNFLVHSHDHCYC